MPRPALAAGLTLALAPSACQTPGRNMGMGMDASPRPAFPQPDASGYPRKAPGREDQGVFPATVAGYRKVGVTEYAPAMSDYQVDYKDLDPRSPDFVSLYLYRDPAPLPALYAATRQVILIQHPGAKIVDEQSLTLSKGGRSYPARTLTLTFDGVFAGQGGRLYSRLLLVALPGYTFKLRATTTAESAALLEPRTQALLDAIDWTSPKAAPGVAAGPGTKLDAT